VTLKERKHRIALSRYLKKLDKIFTSLSPTILFEISKVQFNLNSKIEMLSIFL
jgi:hypothetical protein